MHIVTDLMSLIEDHLVASARNDEKAATDIARLVQTLELIAIRLL